MAYTDEDLKEMMDDCIRQVKELGYDLYPIRDIKFTPGSRDALAYLRAHKDMKYDPYERRWKNECFCIRVHGLMRNLTPDYYMDIKAVVMHEVLHAINPHNGRDSLYSPYMAHGWIFLEAKTKVEAAYGYKHVCDTTVEEMDNDPLLKYFEDNYKKLYPDMIVDHKCAIPRCCRATS